MGQGHGGSGRKPNTGISMSWPLRQQFLSYPIWSTQALLIMTLDYGSSPLVRTSCSTVLNIINIPTAIPKINVKISVTVCEKNLHHGILRTLASDTEWRLYMLPFLHFLLFLFCNILKCIAILCITPWTFIFLFYFF